MNNYKYKQTLDVEVGDLVMWTKLPPSITNRVNNKVYKVIGESCEHNPIVLNEHGRESLYAVGYGFKVLQTKPANQAVVGDYMYRISSGSDTFSKHSVIKITRTDNNNRLGYSEELGVDFNEVIVIAQADPSLVQQAPTIPESAINFALYPSGAPSEPTQPTTKEQPMKLQQLLDTIFGVSDYEAKPKFIVTVFNNDKEVGTTTAESIEEIQQTIQSDTRLWGCKLVAYKIHSELQTQVAVVITKFKKEKEPCN